MFERTRNTENRLLEAQADVFREYGMSETEIAEIMREKVEIEHENILPWSAPHPLDYYWEMVKEKHQKHDE